MAVRGPGVGWRERRPAETPPRRARTAFTLVELLVVAAIIAITAAIAVPRYGASIARFRAESAARRVAADITYARAAAQASSASSTVTFDADAERYTVSNASHLNTRAAGYQVNLAEDPYYAAILAIALGPSSTVSFDGFGRPDIGGSVDIGKGTNQWRVTVEAESGAVKVQRIP